MKLILNLFSLRLIASTLGIFYTILQVRYFGTTRAIELFFAAQSLMYLVASLTQTGQLSEVFLPEYHKLNIKKQGLGFTGLNVILNRMLIFGIFILIGVYFLAPYFMKLMIPGFTEADRIDAILIFRVLLIYLLLQVFISFFRTVLNAETKFNRPEILGIINISINIIVLVAFFKQFGVWSLVISLLIGKFVEFIFYFFNLKKIGYAYHWVFSNPEFDHNSFFKTMRSTILYITTTQIYSIVLTAGVSFLPEGTYAIFKYVQRFATKIRALIVQPFITIFFTEYSKLTQVNKPTRKLLNKYVLSLSYVNIITVIGIITLGDFVIDILWGGEKFTLEDVRSGYAFLIFNGIAISITSLGGLIRKMAVSQGYGKLLYIYWSVAQLVSALSTYLLIKYFQITGLFLIILINVVLLTTASCLVLIFNKKPIIIFPKPKYIILFISVILILVQLKYSSFNVIDSDYYSLLNMLIFAVLTIPLLTYPIFKVYKTFKN